MEGFTRQELEDLHQTLRTYCEQLHSGKTLRLPIGPQMDANGIKAIESCVYGMYRCLFHGNVEIVRMRRDEHDVLQMDLRRHDGGDSR